MPAVFDLIRAEGGVPEAELWEVFNMGCGFVVVVPEGAAGDAVALLAAPPPRRRPRSGRVTAEAGAVRRRRCSARAGARPGVALVYGGWGSRTGRSA